MIVKRLPRFLLLGLFLTLLCLPGLALASQPAIPYTVARASADVFTATLSPKADNTLYEDPNGSLSNGHGVYLFAGRTNQLSNSIRRGLIRFEVTSGLPLTATIVGVTLYLSTSRTMAGPQPVALQRATADWGEGTSDATGEEGSGAPASAGGATWLHRSYTSTLWTTPGGDFSATASATTTVAGEGAYSWSAPGMVADVQMWVNTPETNNGWLLSGNETSPMTAKRFATRENLGLNARPRLVVTYLLLPYKTYLPLASRQ
jgi:hypothetical protein